MKFVMYALIALLVIWALLTLWAQYGGKQVAHKIGNAAAGKRALIIYNPDPIYNLDEQVCKSFAAGLSKHGFFSEILTTKLVPDSGTSQYDLYVFCANTYNWAPDWRVMGIIKDKINLSGKNVVAITLGSGSTARAKRKLEEAIQKEQANLLASVNYWLLKPNDEQRTSEKNAAVANDLAKQLGDSTGRKFLRQ